MDSLYSHPSLYATVNDGRTHDLPYYLALAAEAGGEVLELGAGTGRVTLSLARAGHHVVAVEREAAMVALLTERLRLEPKEVQQRVTTVVEDATKLRLNRRFPLVVCAYNGMAHQLTFQARKDFLSKVDDHLIPGGVFAFDVRLPNSQLLAGGTGYVPWLRHPKYGDVCRAVETTRYDASTQVLEITLVVTPFSSDREPEHTSLSMRLSSAETWHAELTRLGWEVLARDTDGEDVRWKCRKSEGIAPA